MLPKSSRISLDKDIQRLVRSKYQARGGVVRVMVLPRRDNDGARVMVVVGKKYYKRAVKRYKLKRRIFGVMRDQLANGVPANMDICVMVSSKDALYTEYQDLEKQIVKALGEASIKMLKAGVDKRGNKKLNNG